MTSRREAVVCGVGLIGPEAMRQFERHHIIYYLRRHILDKAEAASI